MQPAADRLLPLNRSRLAGEDQEGCLKRVLGVVGISQDAPADTKDHRPMSAHQPSEAGLIVLEGEVPQELAVGANVLDTVGQPVKPVQDAVETSLHSTPRRGRCGRSPLYRPAERDATWAFFQQPPPIRLCRVFPGIRWKGPYARDKSLFTTRASPCGAGFSP